MDGNVSQLTSKSILNLASDFTRANSVCPDDSKPSQSYLQLLSKNDNINERSGSGGGIGGNNQLGRSPLAVSSFSNISSGNRDRALNSATKSQTDGKGDRTQYQFRPYIVENADKKANKSLFPDDNVFSKFGRLVGEQFGVYPSSKSLSDIKRSLSESKDILQKEISITEFSRDYHSKQIMVLSDESKQQRLQLYSWGKSVNCYFFVFMVVNIELFFPHMFSFVLCFIILSIHMFPALSNLIPDFEKMWSCKVRLSALLEEMANGAIEILTKCRNEINFLLFEVRSFSLLSYLVLLLLFY